MRFKDGITEKNIIVKCGSDNFLPFAVVFGLYVILFGTISPGGGFQGGVICASAALLIYLGYGYNTASKALSLEVLRVNESVGAVIYVLLGVLGVAFAANFCTNVLYNLGSAGDLISAGTITFMSYSVGYKVMTGVGFLLLLMLGLLAPEDDGDEEICEKADISKPQDEESTQEEAPQTFEDKTDENGSAESADAHPAFNAAEKEVAGC